MPREKEPPPKKRAPAYYWWTLANILAFCLAVTSWIVILHLFQHPEIPRNYEILRKLGRATPPANLSIVAKSGSESPPRGDTVDPRAAYRRYAELAPPALDLVNAALMRNYLRNLKEPKLVQYAQGDFRIEKIRDLDEHDLFHPGFAVRARAMIPPDEFSDPAPWPVVIDYLFPTSHPDASSWLAPGDILSVQKYPNFAMVLRIDRYSGEDTPLIGLTLVPIAFGEFSVGNQRTFELQAPAALHPGGRLPVFPNEGEP